MARTASLSLLSCLLFVGAFACGDSDPGTADGSVADTGTPTDSGARDLGMSDAGRADAQASDADAGGPADQGTPSEDGGNADAAGPDLGNVDAGNGDAGSVDAGNGDAGNGDAGSQPDAGPIGPTCNPTFGAGDACGGDPVGTWNYTAACVDPIVFATAQQLCPFITSVQLSNTATGTLTLNEDLSFSRTATATFIYDVFVPAVCAQQIGGCPGVAGYIESNITATRRTANCSTQRNSDCNCTVLVEQVSNDSGTYTVDSANGIIVANALEYYYCVSGDDMLYKGTTNNNLDRLISNVLSR